MAAITVPGQEQSVYKRLLDRRYDAFFVFTLKRTYRGRLRRMHEFVLPLFPRLVLVAPRERNQHEVDIESVAEGVRVARYRFSGQPLRIANRVVETLQSAASELIPGRGFFVKNHDVWKSSMAKIHNEPVFVGTAHDIVRLVDEAPYFGALASIVEVISPKRISVRMNMLGALRVVEVPVQAVDKIITAA